MILYLVTLFCLVGKIESLTCLSCKNISQQDNCTSVITCNVGLKCYTTAVGIGQDTVFNLGCHSEQDCLGQSSSSIVGRSLDTQCSQCCAVDRCNKKLCSAGTQVTNEVGVCSDDPNYDCQQISTLFNICGDVAHAKTACRKWCGLCNLVDGGWTVWTAWTNCDVTCGHGHVTRSRTCTDPAPAHGGLPCVGNTSETGTCDLDPCPVHGGWSSWVTWTSCSHTCGIGTQSRRRACDNPVPKLFGDHCFGDPMDFKSCFMRSCHDGGWSSWTSWSSCTNGRKTRTRACDNPQPSQFGKTCSGNDEQWDNFHGGWSSWVTWTSCSHTCGIGTQSRRRACDNPVPKLFGDHCFGDPMDFKSCFMRSCHDGGWSSWTSWSSCTNGRKTRTRACDNPQPSQFGKTCSGNDEQWDNCGPVAFTVTSSNKTIVAGHPLFTNVVTNVGGGYSPDTGIFTCPIAGLYLFSLSIMAYRIDVYCWIGRNGANIANAQTDGSSNDYNMASTSAYLQLSFGDKVSLQSCGNWDYVYTNQGSSFSGSLIN